MKHKTIYTILIVLSLISLLSSLALSFSPTSEVCQIGEINEDGCLNVHNSPYNYTFGIQNSYYGIAIFSLLTLVLYSQLRKPSKKKTLYIRTTIIVGAIIAIYFILLQIFVIGSYCQYCLLVDFNLLVSLFIIAYDWRYN